MAQIKAIITDFDGTLVDTFKANYAAYCVAFKKYLFELTYEQYQAFFGLRYDDFMKAMHVTDKETKALIREEKARVYPLFFDKLIPNNTLIALIRNAKTSGVKTAIASTANEVNLRNVLAYLNLTDMFDVILTGGNVRWGKPNPEIYFAAMEHLGIKPEHTLIFEDSKVGIQAAQASGASYIKVDSHYFI